MKSYKLSFQTNYNLPKNLTGKYKSSLSSQMLNRNTTLAQRLHEYLCVHPDQPNLQIHSSHKCNSKLFKARLICFVYISVVYIWCLAEMHSVLTNFIYLTLQGYFMTWLFYAVVLQDYWLSKNFAKDKHPCPKLKHYVQIIYETALCFEFPITLVFWTFLFKILIDQGASTQQIIMNTNLHLGPLVCLLVQLYYNNFTFPKKHLWVLIIYGSGYLLINLVYSLTVKLIYKPIDWKSVLSYILVMASLLFVIGAHYIGRVYYRRRKATVLRNIITEGLIEEIEPRKGDFTLSPSTDTNGNNNLNPYQTKNSYPTENLNSYGRNNVIPEKDNNTML